MSFGFGVLIAVLLLILPGAVVALAGRLRWYVALGVGGPVLTYGVVGLAIIPFGAIGIRWNVWTALLALAIVTAVVFGLRMLLTRYRAADPPTVDEVSLWPALVVAAGVIFGALLIGFAAWRGGMPYWQSIPPSNWDSVWHANTIRWILDTGQASSTHMGELRNVETHASLYYPPRCSTRSAPYWPN